MLQKAGAKCLLLCVVLSLFCWASAELKLGYYKKSCPNAEKIIRDIVSKKIRGDPGFSADLLRMQFHDCFVRGCDGSLFLDSTRKAKAEKEAEPNLTLEGFDFIDEVKKALEDECPGVVSCADLIALVARDAVVTIGGPSWNVLTGRRDGLISLKSEADKILPLSSFHFKQLQELFASKHLDIKDLVVLSGAHTIGISHCPSFSNRLYNFTGKGDVDPSLNRHYAQTLKRNKCKTPTDTTTEVEMDPGSFTTFDLGYYKNLLRSRGLFESDATLTTNGLAYSIITKLVNSPVQYFFQEFASSMEKMIVLDVKTGYQGEIRKKCTVVNN